MSGDTLCLSERIRYPVSEDDSFVVLPTDAIDTKPSFYGNAETCQEDELPKLQFDCDEASAMSILEVEHEWQSQHHKRIYPRLKFCQEIADHRAR
jgi:hypothetical protein